MLAGMPATMPPKMIIDMPLPIPFSVMRSPIHTRKIVPASMDSSMAAVGRRALPVSPILTPSWKTPWLWK